MDSRIKILPEEKSDRQSLDHQDPETVGGEERTSPASGDNTRKTPSPTPPIRRVEVHQIERNRSISYPLPSSWQMDVMPPQPGAPPAFQHPPYGLTRMLETVWNAVNLIQGLIGLLQPTAPVKVDAGTEEEKTTPQKS